MALAEFFADLIFPKQCFICGRYGEWLCGLCANALQSAFEQICITCRKPSINGLTHPKCATRMTLDGLLAAGLFGQLQELIHAFKYENCRELSGPLGEFLSQFAQRNGYENFFKSFTVAPVPLHERRLRYRGFNQSALLAKKLASRLGVPIAENWIRRDRDRKPQMSLNRTERLLNLADAFAVSLPDEIGGKNILLIDDVATTGATLAECAKALKKAGAKKVWGLVLAHA